MNDSARTSNRAVPAYTDELQTHERLRSSRRPAGGYRPTFSRHRGGGEASGPAWRDRVREDNYGGPNPRAGGPPPSVSPPQKKARRPAPHPIPKLLPPQRRGIHRQLLLLLPAA